MRKLLLLLLFPCLLSAQSGTIRIQRNPSPDTVFKCGGIWTKAWLTFEIRSLSTIDKAFQPLPRFRGGPHNNYTKQISQGAHVIFSNPHAVLFYSSRFTTQFALLTGFDRFVREGGDSTYASGKRAAFHINTNRFPLALRMNVSLIDRPRFFMTFTGETGKDLLFIEYISSIKDNHTAQKWTNCFSAGLGFHFTGRRQHFHTGITIRSTWLDDRWYRDLAVSFPIFYGKYRKGSAGGPE